MEDIFKNSNSNSLIIDSDNNKSIKVVFLGEYGVGKTELIDKFCGDTKSEILEMYNFVYKSMEFPDLKKNLLFEIHNSVGQKAYRNINKIFFKDADVIIFVFDLTIENSFEEIKNYWYPSVKNNNYNNPILAIAANSIELKKHSKINIEDAENFANSIGAFFQETSIVSDDGIVKLFDKIGRKYISEKKL